MDQPFDPSVLVDGDLRLRLPTSDDVTAITALCQDPDIQRWTRIPSPYTEDDARGFVAAANLGVADGTAIHLLVVPVDDPATILGAVGVSLDPADFSGEVGYWLGRDARGRGIATRAARMICRVAFEQLGARYLLLTCAEGNAASNAIASRLGFALEGVLREAMIDGPSGERSAPRCDANLWGLRPGELTEDPGPR
jgi:RimJ/RimL family protein N-acetyltransferase